MTQNGASSSATTDKLSAAVNMVRQGTMLMKYLRQSPTSSPHHYFFALSELDLSWEGKGKKKKVHRVAAVRRGTVLRPDCDKSFTITLCGYGDLLLAAESKLVTEAWVNALHFLLWACIREQVGMSNAPLGLQLSSDGRTKSFSSPGVKEGRNQKASMEISPKILARREKAYRRLAVSGDSGEVCDRIMLKQKAINDSRYCADTREKKDPVTSAMLLDIVNRVPFFKNLSIAMRKLLVDNLVREDVAAGSVVMEQGDSGDTLYLITEGSLDIVIESEGECKTVHTSEAGSWFGEIALLYDMPRTATVRAKTDSRLWGLSRKDFVLLSELSQDWSMVLRELPIFALMDKAGMDKVFKQSYSKVYAAGTVLQKVSEFSKSLRIILKGKIKSTATSVTKKQVNRWLVTGDTLAPEETLRGNAVREDLVVEEEATLLCIDCEHLQDYLEELVQAQNDYFKRQVLKSVPMLSGMVRQTAVDLFDSFSILNAKNGKAIIEQFSMGNEFYIIVSGHVEVQKRADPSEAVGSGNFLTTLERGQYFGELALLSGDLRSADVIVTSEIAKFFVLSRTGWERLMGNLSTVLELKNTTRLLAKVPLLSVLSEDAVLSISRAMKAKKFVKGDVVVKEGDEGDAFYIVTEGHFTVNKKGLGNVKDLYKGDHFGERALIQKEPRAATVTAVTDSCVLMTSADLFEVHMKSLKETMRMSIIEQDAKAAQVKEIQERAKNSRQDVEMEVKKAIRRLSVTSIENMIMLNVLGEGAFGRVNLALYKKMDLPCALKILVKERIIAENTIRHLHDEVTFLRKVHHPFVVQLYKTWSDKRIAYILMEYIPGGELFRLLQNQGHLKEDAARFYTAQVVSAFAYLHARDIIYRDLKPENLVLDADGYIKLVDFGFAKSVPRGYVTLTVCGTPEYVAPEIISRKGHDRAVDLWAVGILIYELLTGNAPFQPESNDPARIYSRILNEEPHFGAKGWAKLSPAAPDIIRRLLHKNQKERLGSGKKGIQDILDHEWFNSIDWVHLENRGYPAPHPVELSSKVDASNFDLDLSNTFQPLVGAVVEDSRLNFLDE